MPARGGATAAPWPHAPPTAAPHRHAHALELVCSQPRTAASLASPCPQATTHPHLQPHARGTHAPCRHAEGRPLLRGPPCPPPTAGPTGMPTRLNSFAATRAPLLLGGRLHGGGVGWRQEARVRTASRVRAYVGGHRGLIGRSLFDLCGGGCRYHERTQGGCKMQEWAGSGAGMEGGAGTVAGTVAGTQAPAAAGRTRQSGGGGGVHAMGGTRVHGGILCPCGVVPGGAGSRRARGARGRGRQRQRRQRSRHQRVGRLDSGAVRSSAQHSHAGCPAAGLQVFSGRPWRRGRT